jgi:sterol 3beta-glucosyltransferase
VPIPRDFPLSAHVTGFWFLDADPTWQPDSALEHFLAAGPTPVYVGFGSMIAGDNAQARTEVIIAALAAAGLRGILSRGWGGLTDIDFPEHVHVVDDVPHDWLFPRVAAVVHHGGSGTTAAGLRAGRPTLVCPVLGDQPFWGQVVQRLGAGPAPIALKGLTVSNLTPALTALTTSPGFAARAGAVGEALRAEDGPGNAIRVLEQRL